MLILYLFYYLMTGKYWNIQIQYFSISFNFVNFIIYFLISWHLYHYVMFLYILGNILSSEICFLSHWYSHSSFLISSVCNIMSFSMFLFTLYFKRGTCRQHTFEAWFFIQPENVIYYLKGIDNYICINYLYHWD